MKELIKIFSVVVLMLAGSNYVSAQEEISTSIQEETEMSEESNNNTEEISTSTSEELTEEEIIEIIEESEELTEEDIESPEDLEGEVILVTEEVVVIETSSGNTVKIETDTYTKNRPGSGARMRRLAKLEAGQKIETGEITLGVDDIILIATLSGQYEVNKETVITKGNKTISIDDISEEDNVVVILNEDGEVIAIEVISEDNSEETEGQEEKSNMIWLILGLIILISISVPFFKKKNRSKLEV